VCFDKFPEDEDDEEEADAAPVRVSHNEVVFNYSPESRASAVPVND